MIGVMIGGVSDEMQHSRVELFRKQWDSLAAAKPVEALKTKPLAEIAAAFSRIAKELPPIAVEVLVDGKPRALGTVVASDGLVLTKASALAGAVSCRLADGRTVPASIQKQSRQHDLAVLKIDAAGLPEVRWSQDDSIVAGTLVAAVVPGKQTLAGIVTNAARPKPAAVGGQQATEPGGDRAPSVHESAFGTDILLKKESCGGPLIDRGGRVVGIVIACQTEPGGFGQSQVIPASVARSVVAD